MKILIASHDVIPEKSHLMPWRTLCEVTLQLRTIGHEVTLVSLAHAKTKLVDSRLPIGTVSVRKEMTYLSEDLHELITELQPDVVFWPISWRESMSRTRVVAQFNRPVIGYFPGGYYSLSTCWYALQKMGYQLTKPYLVEALIPHFLQLWYLKFKGFKAIITMTELTAQHVRGISWQDHEVVCIPPGKELVNDLAKVGVLPSTFQSWLQQRPYYLYMGPPSSIRGIYQLLQAFEVAATQNSDICLVCLFRSDAKLDTEAIAHFIENMVHKNRVYRVWESVPKSLLNAYIAGCHAVAMPFILVPSEIPLAIIETIQWGKPVISTQQGGTGDFVAQFGFSPVVGDINGLAKAMLDLYQEPMVYQQKCDAVHNVYLQHPDWQMMAKQWLKLAQTVIKEST